MKPKTMVVVKQEPARGSVVVSTASQQQRVSTASELIRCKRKNGCQPFAPQPASVARRNARERNRVKQVNNGFATLRSHIPPAVAAALTSEKTSSRGSSAAAKKLSKVETLKMAVEYIRSLQELLDEQSVSLETKYEPEDNYYSSSPETLASSGDAAYYSHSPDTFPKSEGDGDYYTPNRNFNSDMHETLTTEFYHVRSPVKGSTYIDNDDVPVPQTHSFIPPKAHQTSSLSPPISDPCPSPTPSYSSDHSSLHAGSIVSTGSGQLTNRMSRLTTMTQPQHIPVVAQHHRSSPDYDSYEAMSPEDEELLDVISMWQQSN